MKRQHVNRSLQRGNFATLGDIRKVPSLALIGAVCLAYNGTEALLDVVLAIALRLYDFGIEVTSRINGTEGKIEIIKAALKRLEKIETATEEMHVLISETLGENGFMQLKRYRDAVVHGHSYSFLGSQLLQSNEARHMKS